MKTNTTFLLSALKVIFWIIFIGYLIHAGALLTSYMVSLFKPEAANNLYLGLDLSELYQWNLWQYSAYLSFWIVILLFKAYLAYLVIRIFSKLDLNNPFSETIAAVISKISHVALSAGLIAVIAKGHTKWLLKEGMEVSHNWGSGELLFLAAIIFIIAQVFRKGIDIQSENELTI